MIRRYLARRKMRWAVRWATRLRFRQRSREWPISGTTSTMIIGDIVHTQDFREV